MKGLAPEGSAFARFRAERAERGEVNDLEAFSRLTESQKRMHQFAAQFEGRWSDSASSSAARLPRLMEGLDSAIAKLEKKIVKLQGQLDEMKQWKATLVEEMDRAQKLLAVATVAKEVLPAAPNHSPAISPAKRALPPLENDMDATRKTLLFEESEVRQRQQEQEQLQTSALEERLDVQQQPQQQSQQQMEAAESPMKKAAVGASPVKKTVFHAALSEVAPSPLKKRLLEDGADGVGLFATNHQFHSDVPPASDIGHFRVGAELSSEQPLPDLQLDPFDSDQHHQDQNQQLQHQQHQHQQDRHLQDFSVLDEQVNGPISGQDQPIVTDLGNANEASPPAPLSNSLDVGPSLQQHDEGQNPQEEAAAAEAPLAPVMVLSSKKSTPKPKKCLRCAGEGHTAAACLMTDKDHAELLKLHPELAVKKKSSKKSSKEATAKKQAAAADAAAAAAAAAGATPAEVKADLPGASPTASFPAVDDEPLIAVPSKKRGHSGRKSGGKSSSTTPGSRKGSGKKSAFTTPTAEMFRTSCEVCGKAGLRTKEKLQEHLQTHVTPDHCCPIPTCKQLCKSDARVMSHLTLEHHMVSSADEAKDGLAMSPDSDFVIPPGTMLECFECSDRFNNAIELDCHIRRHMVKQYPRECNLVLGSEGAACNFKASSQDDMARHIIEAHYELQSECSACGSAELAHECPVKPEHIVGKRVSVRWLRENDIAWYDGVVKKYLPDKDMFEIFYDDGTNVTESLSMRYWRPLQRVLPSKK